MIERIPFLGRLFRQPSGRGKKTVFLHIGMGKTGTTALQEFFWANRKNLAERGIAYPSHGAVSHAHHLLSPHRPPFLTGSWRFEDVAEWAPVVDRLGEGKVLLSSELIAWAKPEIVSEFCAELKRWFDVRVVVYVRRQDDLIMAGYNQQIKAGTQQREIHDILERQFQRFDYSAKLRPWEEALGKDAIILRPYERAQFHEGDIRFDFLYHVFGIDGFTEFELPSGNSNPRLSYGAMEFKRLINNIFPDTNESSQFTPTLLSYSAESDESSTSIYANQALLSPQERVSILERFESVNSELSKRYLGRGDGRLFYSSWPDPREEWDCPKLTTSELKNIAGYIESSAPGLGRQLREHLCRYQSAAASPAAQEAFRLLCSAFGIDSSGDSRVREQGLNYSKIWVHFGIHKTGSSAIQDYLWSADLPDYVDYYSFDRPNSSLLIGNCFLDTQTLATKRGLASREEAKEVQIRSRERFANSLKDKLGENLIISAEVVSHFDRDSLNSLVRFLSEYAQEVSFIGYVREPVSYAVSAFQEGLKLRYRSFSFHNGQVISLVRQMIECVGFDNVELYSYDRDDFPDGSVVSHFCRRFGISCPEERKRDQDANTSLTLPAVKALYAYRRLGVQSDFEINDPKSLPGFIKIISGIKGGKFSFSPELANKVKKQNFEVYSWLESQFGIVFRDYGPDVKNGVSSEKELLIFTEDDLAELRPVLGAEATCDAENIAHLMGLLRLEAKGKAL